jgi:16S rRNA (uracil1498-N3)-methyltransferase
VPRIFVDSKAVVGERVHIGGADALHLTRSLRARPGEVIVVVADGRTEYGVVIDQIRRASVEGGVAWSRPATGEAVLESHILQAIPQRGMDQAVEALSETGATNIHPVLTRRTVPQPDPPGAERRLERWRAIAREASQLALRARAPVIHPIGTVAEACAALPDDTVLLVAALQGGRPLGVFQVDPERPLAIAIGPEGGFDAGELAALDAAGGETVHLGRRVLPARIAGAVALSLVLARAGELDAPVAPPPKI